MTIYTPRVAVPMLVALSLSFSACKKSEDNPVVASTTTRLTTTLNGANEKPTSTTSPATASFVGDLNTTTRILSYTVTYQGFPTTDPPTAGHLHRVTNADGTGPVDINFPSPLPASPCMAVTGVLAQSKVDSLLGGKYYANMHTKIYPGGAIWGDVRK